MLSSLMVASFLTEKNWVLPRYSPRIECYLSIHPAQLPYFEATNEGNKRYERRPHFPQYMYNTCTKSRNLAFGLDSISVMEIDGHIKHFFMNDQSDANRIKLVCQLCLECLTNTLCSGEQKLLPNKVKTRCFEEKVPFICGLEWDLNVILNSMAILEDHCFLCNVKLSGVFPAGKNNSPHIETINEANKSEYHNFPQYMYNICTINPKLAFGSVEVTVKEIDGQNKHFFMDDQSDTNRIKLISQLCIECVANNEVGEEQKLLPDVAKTRPFVEKLRIISGLEHTMIDPIEILEDHCFLCNVKLSSVFPAGKKNSPSDLNSLELKKLKNKTNSDKFFNPSRPSAKLLKFSQFKHSLQFFKLISEIKDQTNYFSIESLPQHKNLILLCTLCNRSLEHVEAAKNHVTEKEHLLNFAKNSANVVMLPTITKDYWKFLLPRLDFDDFICNLCDYRLSDSPLSWMEHFQGVSHITLKSYQLQIDSNFSLRSFFLKSLEKNENSLIRNEGNESNNFPSSLTKVATEDSFTQRNENVSNILKSRKCLETCVPSVSHEYEFDFKNAYFVRFRHSHQFLKLIQKVNYHANYFSFESQPELKFLKLTCMLCNISVVPKDEDKFKCLATVAATHVEDQKHVLNVSENSSKLKFSPFVPTFSEENWNYLTVLSGSASYFCTLCSVKLPAICFEGSSQRASLLITLWVEHFQSRQHGLKLRKLQDGVFNSENVSCDLSDKVKYSAQNNAPMQIHCLPDISSSKECEKQSEELLNGLPNLMAPKQSDEKKLSDKKDSECPSAISLAKESDELKLRKLQDDVFNSENVSRDLSDKVKYSAQNNAPMQTHCLPDISSSKECEKQSEELLNGLPNLMTLKQSDEKKLSDKKDSECSSVFNFGSEIITEMFPIDLNSEFLSNCAVLDEQHEDYTSKFSLDDDRSLNSGLFYSCSNDFEALKQEYNPGTPVKIIDLDAFHSETLSLSQASLVEHDTNVYTLKTLTPLDFIGEPHSEEESKLKDVLNNKMINDSKDKSKHKSIPQAPSLKNISPDLFDLELGQNFGEQFKNESISNVPSLLPVNLFQDTFNLDMFKFEEESMLEWFEKLAMELNYQINYFAIDSKTRSNKMQLVCKLCDKSMHVSEAKQHINEQEHLGNIVANCARIMRPSGAANISEEHWQFLDFSESSQEYFCTLCKVKLSSNRDLWAAHFCSDVHGSKFKKLETVRSSNKSKTEPFDEPKHSTKKNQDTAKNSNARHSTPILPVCGSVEEKSKESKTYVTQSNLMDPMYSKVEEHLIKSTKSNEQTTSNSNSPLQLVSIDSTYQFIKIESYLTSFSKLKRAEKDFIKKNWMFILIREDSKSVFCTACHCHLSIKRDLLASFNCLLEHLRGYRHECEVNNYGPAAYFQMNILSITFYNNETGFCNICNVSLCHCVPQDIDFLLNHFESAKHSDLVREEFKLCKPKNDIVTLFLSQKNSKSRVCNSKKLSTNSK